MKYQRFEDLPVWKAAIDLAVQIFTLTSRQHFRGCGDLKNQMERSSLSISNNIAEGFERGTTQELLTFIYIARGSAGELRSMLLFLERLPNFNDFKSEIADLKSSAESVARQLRAWADSLQNSDIKGQRYLTDKTRRAAAASDEQQKFLEELRRCQEENMARVQKMGEGKD